MDEPRYTLKFKLRGKQWEKPKKKGKGKKHSPRPRKLNSRIAKLHHIIDLSGRAYNHIVLLHRRWYKLFGKKNAEWMKLYEESFGYRPPKLTDPDWRRASLDVYFVQSHLAKLKKSKKFAWLKEIPSQSLQEAAKRVDSAYQRFFDSLKRPGCKVSPPKLKNIRKYKSFTLKQAGWECKGGDVIRIGKAEYRFYKSREITGTIQTLTVKRDACGDLYLCFSCTAKPAQSEGRPMTGQSAGIDFGLIAKQSEAPLEGETFLTIADDTGHIEKITAPQPLKKKLSKLRKKSQKFSCKVEELKKRRKATAEQWDGKGDKPYIAPSKSYLKSKRELVKYHRHIANARSDWQWKLARKLSLTYDTIYIEDLTFSGMSRMWGRKTSDLAPYSFFQKLEFECCKNGCELVRRDKFFASTQICHSCGEPLDKKLKLGDRTWECPKCGAEHDRDANAAINILKGRGASQCRNRRKTGDFLLPQLAAVV